ncbi:MAG: FAD-dependent monooxygenase [Proteobacteria bacterium]|nr:FAD-dependent monooxygenase [Pseudomonadota bacterium]
MKAVICGAGISGLTLAWWLAQDGWEVTLVERAAGPRDEGYMIDFFGSGFDAAERMGLLERLRAVAYKVDEVVFANGNGERQAALNYIDLRKALDGKLLSLMRGDLERVLYDVLPDSVARHYDCTITDLRNSRDGVRVTLSDGTTLNADLLAGADGIHSDVRARVFGPESRFFRNLGFQTAAYIYRDAATLAALHGDFTLATVPKRTAGLYGLRDGRVAAFLVHHAGKAPLPRDRVTALRAEFDRFGWLMPTALAHAGDGPIYYDHVAQIEMRHWQKDRVVLLGDACAAVSLLAGQGASMGMAMAYVLAEELRGAKDIPTALKAYERRLQPELRTRQKAGRGAAASFVPMTRFQLWLRDTMLRLARWRIFSFLLTPLFLAGGKSFIR